MKKSNFFAMACTIAALASCTSDDLKLDSGFKLADDGSQVLVTIADDDNYGMRAGFGILENEDGTPKSQRGFFTVDDEFKMYCIDTWKPQVYKFKENVVLGEVTNAAVFEYAKESPYNDGDVSKMTNREYAVFPADKFEFRDEKRTSLVFTLDADNVYDGTYTSSEIKDGNDTRALYTALVPMFGFNTGLGTETDKGAIDFRYMTGLVRVQLRGLPAGKHVLTLSGNEEHKYRMSGTFYSSIDDFNPAEYTPTVDNLPVFDREELTASSENDHISVTFTTSEKQLDYYVYIPLPTGKYNKEALTLTRESYLSGNTTAVTKQIDFHAINATPWDNVEADEQGDITVGRGNFLLAKDETAVEYTCNATRLSEINAYLAQLPKIDRDVTIKLPNQVASFVWDKMDGIKDSTLVIPAWGEYKVTLNFDYVGSDGNSTSLVSFGQDLTAKESPIGETVKVTPVEVHNLGNANVVINVANVVASRGKTVVLVTKNEEGTVTLGTNVTDVEAKAGKIAIDAENTKIGTGKVIVTTAEDTNTSIEVLSGTVATLTHNADGDITVKGGTVEALTNNGSGDITIENAAFGTLVNGETGGDVTIKNLTTAASSLTTMNPNKNLTITNEGNTPEITAVTAASDKINITNMISWNTLTITGAPSEINVTDYRVNKLVYNGEKEITYNSYGKSSIIEKDVTNKAYEGKVKFVSKWDGEPYTELAVYTRTKGVYSDNGRNVYDVYTAAELAMLLDNTLGNNKSNFIVHLYADIDLDGKDWTGIEAFANATGTTMFDGKDHKIENVNIVLPETASNTKQGYGFINQTSKRDRFEAQNLTLKGVKTTIENTTQKIYGVGGFVGAQWNTAKYTSIKVVNDDATSILGDATTGKYGDVGGVYHVGGLIGKIYDYNAENISSNTNVPKTIIEQCKVNLTGNIVGKFALGGLVGDARGRGDGPGTSIELEITNDTVSLGGFTVTLTVDQNNTDSHYGRVGMLVGTVSGSGTYTKLKFGENNKVDNCIDKTALKFGLCRRYIEGENKQMRTEMFDGAPYNGSIYVGYSPDFDNVVNKGTSEGIVEGLGTGDDAITTINGFNKFSVVTTNYAPKRK